MEEIPGLPFKPEEDEDQEDDDSPDNKGLWAQSKKPQKAGEIGKSLLNATKKEEQTSLDKESDDETPEMLSPEEETEVTRAIAVEHLTNPVVSEPPAEAVTDYLYRVVEGVPLDQAFEIARDRQTDTQPAEAVGEKTDNPDKTVVNNEVASTEPYNYSAKKYQEYRHQTSENSPLATANRPRQRTLSDELVSYVSKRKRSTSQPAKTAHAEHASIKHQIDQLNNRMIAQENTLQTLSRNQPERIEKLRHNTANLVRQYQSGNLESRLNLNKPVKVEQIGKMILRKTELPASEKMSAAQVKTISRQELLGLSGHIEVSGGNLRKMYENNLFSEAALRRLVVEHIRGHSVETALKREIVQQKVGFEKDPLLRMHGLIDRNGMSDLEKSIGHLTAQAQASQQIVKQIATRPEYTDPDSVKRSAFKHAMVTLAVVVVLLLILIIWLLIKRK